MKSFSDNADSAVVGLLYALLGLLMVGLNACHLVPAHPAEQDAVLEQPDELQS